MEWALKYASLMEELEEIARLHEEEVHAMLVVESLNDSYSAKLGQSVAAIDLTVTTPSAVGSRPEYTPCWRTSASSRDSNDRLSG
jgi:hypothetical protein